MEDCTQPFSRRDALIVDALSAVFAILRGLPRSAHTRELLAQARSFDAAVKHWTTVPPGEPQLEAMLDLVADLHAKVLTLSRAKTKRRRSSAG